MGKNGGIRIPWQLTSSFFVWYVHRALSHPHIAENMGKAASDRNPLVCFVSS